jgi:hypothetical protein
MTEDMSARRLTAGISSRAACDTTTNHSTSPSPQQPHRSAVDLELPRHPNALSIMAYAAATSFSLGVRRLPVLRTMTLSLTNLCFSRLSLPSTSAPSGPRSCGILTKRRSKRRGALLASWLRGVLMLLFNVCVDRAWELLSGCAEAALRDPSARVRTLSRVVLALHVLVWNYIDLEARQAATSLDRDLIREQIERDSDRAIQHWRERMSCGMASRRVDKTCAADLARGP